MTRAFNIEGLVRLQNHMGGKTLEEPPVADEETIP